MKFGLESKMEEVEACQNNLEQLKAIVRFQWFVKMNSL